MCSQGTQRWNRASAFNSNRLLGEGRDEPRKTLRYRVGDTAGHASFPAQLIREDVSEEVAVELGFE